MPAYKAIPAITESTLANGDVLYWHAADAEYKRLAAGTDTHVLTLASGLPTWAAGGSATDDNYCLIHYTSDYTGIVTSTWTTIEWDSGVAVTDPQTMLYDTGSNPSKIRPTATGRYLVTFNCRWNDNNTGQRVHAIYHLNSSGNTLGRAAQQHPASYGSEASVSGVFAIGSADSEYFIVRVYQSSGADRLLHGNSTPATGVVEEMTAVTVHRISA